MRCASALLWILAAGAGALPQEKPETLREEHVAFLGGKAALERTRFLEARFVWEPPSPLGGELRVLLRRRPFAYREEWPHTTVHRENPPRVLTPDRRTRGFCSIPGASTLRRSVDEG